MVKEPDRLLSLAYAGATVRPRLEAVFALDSALADVLRTVREPMIARIRLAGWREQI
jgi:phytoene synthase